MNNKKHFCQLLLAFFGGVLLVCGVSATVPQRVSSGVYGDVDGNGVVDVQDLNEVINVMLGRTPGGGTSATTTYTVNGVTFTMVNVEGGTFTMGATAEQGSDAWSDEKPTHEVTLSDFAIGQTEVTQELWVAVMGSNPSWFNGYGNSDYGSYHSNVDYGTNLQRPVEMVTWEDCQAFIAKLNSLTGRTFRLPTEAEWEYAARGGQLSEGHKYAGSDDIGKVAWYTSNAYSVGSSNSNYGTHSVATKAPNELSLYDMTGNVWEWCADWYGDYSSSPQTNPTGPASGSKRVCRGGSWNSNAVRCRVSTRSSQVPAYRAYRQGLRLAL